MNSGLDRKRKIGQKLVRNWLKIGNISLKFFYLELKIGESG